MLSPLCSGIVAFIVTMNLGLTVVLFRRIADVHRWIDRDV